MWRASRLLIRNRAFSRWTFVCRCLPKALMISQFWDTMMATSKRNSSERRVLWVQASHRDLLSLPEMVRERFATAVDASQFGGKDPIAKAWKGLGPGVFELARWYRGNTYRLVYAVCFPGAVYVLHAFQKRSPSGRKTAQRDVRMVRRRYVVARDDYEVRYETEQES